MSLDLIKAVESAVSTVVQEFDKDASVMVQFAAGEWAKLKEELAKAKAAFEPTQEVPQEPVYEPPVYPVVEEIGAPPVVELPPVTEI
jgi:1-aminocyclopropane-1-carboxylate deaminase/D-cysteine desulfhydrase-like pyridoxal-dependent ACC family enzyme